MASNRENVILKQTIRKLVLPKRAAPKLVEIAALREQEVTRTQLSCRSLAWRYEHLPNVSQIEPACLDVRNAQVRSENCVGWDTRLVQRHARVNPRNGLQRHCSLMPDDCISNRALHPCEPPGAFFQWGHGARDSLPLAVEEIRDGVAMLPHSWLYRCVRYKLCGYTLESGDASPGSLTSSKKVRRQQAVPQEPGVPRIVRSYDEHLARSERPSPYETTGDRAPPMCEGW